MQTHFLLARGLLWGSLDCLIVRILDTELSGHRDPVKYRTHKPRAIFTLMPK